MNGKEKPTAPPPNPKEKLGSGLRPEEETKPKVKPENDETKEVPIEKEKLKEVEVLPKGSKVDLTKEEKPKEGAVTTDPKILERISGELWERLLRKVFEVQLTRMERMLEWLIVQRVTDDQKLIKQPNIADIFKEIATKMEDEKTEGGGPGEEEIPPTT